MTERTREILATMKRQAIKTLNAVHRNHVNWYEIAHARGQLSVINIIEGEFIDDSDKGRNNTTLCG